MASVKKGNDISYIELPALGGNYGENLDWYIDGSATTRLYTYELQLLMVTQKDRLVLHFLNVLDN